MNAAITDQRLKPVVEAIAAGQVKVLSVDIFDTLLWRRVPEPKDVFPILARRMHEGGLLSSHVTPLAFAALREAAEKTARSIKQAATGSREVTLADIYREIPDFVFTANAPRDARVAAEIAAEQAMMVLDDQMAALIAHAKSQGATTLLVSDTYFSAATVRAFATAAGFDMAPHQLYVSCEAGRPKWRDLFDVILKDVGVAPVQMTHIGDNVDADVTPCRLRGITHVFYDKWAFSPRVRDREFSKDKQQRTAVLGGVGDRGITGLRSRVAHRPPAGLIPALHPYWRYGASVLAPAFAGFARWVVASCQAAKVGTIHGIMREGRFLNRLVAAAAADLGVGLKTRELWLSRRAVARAALFDDDLSALPDYVLLSPGRTTDETLAEMGLSRGDLTGVLPPTFELRQAGALQALCEAIAQAPAVRAKVLAASAQHRENLLSGLKTAAALDAQDMAVMDLGYAGTIQTVLTRILARSGQKVHLVGFYLALNDKAAVHVGAGADLRAYLDQGGYDGIVGRILSRTPDVLEHACMCREGSLSHYDQGGRPVLLANQRDDAQLAQMETMQDGILTGVAAINRLLGPLAQTPAACPELKAQIAALIEQAILYPTPDEAGTVGQWRHEANFDLEDKRRLTDMAIDPAELAYRGWPALANLGRHQVYWPAAALVLADQFVAEAFAAAVKGEYPPNVLGSGTALGALAIAGDFGAGFDAKRGGAVALAVNTFGRGEISVALKPYGGDAMARVRLQWPKAAAIAQIDSVAAIHNGDGGQVVRNIARDAVTWTGAAEQPDGSIAISKAGALCEFALSPPSGPHATDLVIRFKYLRLDGLFGQA